MFHAAPCLDVARSQAHMCRLLDPELMLSALLSWQDIKGVTPLMLAARGGHAECLELLLRHGANPLLLDSVNNRYACTLTRLGLDNALHLVQTMSTAGLFSSPVACSPAGILQHAQAAHALSLKACMCVAPVCCWQVLPALCSRCWACALHQHPTQRVCLRQPARVSEPAAAGAAATAAAGAAAGSDAQRQHQGHDQVCVCVAVCLASQQGRCRTGTVACQNLSST